MPTLLSTNHTTNPRIRCPTYLLLNRWIAYSLLTTSVPQFYSHWRNHLFQSIPSCAVFPTYNMWGRLHMTEPYTVEHISCTSPTFILRKIKHLTLVSALHAIQTAQKWSKVSQPSQPLYHYLPTFWRTCQVPSPMFATQVKASWWDYASFICSSPQYSQATCPSKISLSIRPYILHLFFLPYLSTNTHQQPHIRLCEQTAFLLAKP